MSKEKIVKKTHKGEEVVGDSDDLGALVDVSDALVLRRNSCKRPHLLNDCEPILSFVSE